MKKLGVFIQARSKSTRFPRKIYQEIAGKSMLKHCYDLAESMSVPKNAMEKEVAVLGVQSDQELVDYCAKENLTGYFWDGSEKDVVSRYAYAAKTLEADFIIRYTSDCPAMQKYLLEDAAKALLEVDYVSNCMIRSFQEGLDVQACTRKALEWFDEFQTDEREHPFKPFEENAIHRKSFVEAGFTYRHILNQSNPIFQKLSIDTPQDLENVKRLIIKTE